MNRDLKINLLNVFGVALTVISLQLVIIIRPSEPLIFVTSWALLALGILIVLVGIKIDKKWAMTKIKEVQKPAEKIHSSLYALPWLIAFSPIILTLFTLPLGLPVKTDEAGAITTWAYTLFSLPIGLILCLISLHVKKRVNLIAIIIFISIFSLPATVYLAVKILKAIVEVNS